MPFSLLRPVNNKAAIIKIELGVGNISDVKPGIEYQLKCFVIPVVETHCTRQGDQGWRTLSRRERFDGGTRQVGTSGLLSATPYDIKSPEVDLGIGGVLNTDDPRCWIAAYVLTAIRGTQR